MDEVTAEAVEATEQVSAPTVVGEQGPEVFVPSTSAVVVPNAELVVTPVDVSATKSAFAAFVAAVEADIAKAHAFEVYEVANIRSRIAAIKTVLDRK